MIDQAVILCGGKGTRLVDPVRGEDYSQGVPKPLIEVGGVPFVSHVLDTLRYFGVHKQTLIVRKQDLHHFASLLQRYPHTTVLASDNIDEVVLGLDLSEFFVLVNGDCLPVMSMADWRDMLSVDKPCVTVKTVGGRDAGLAVVFRQDVVKGKVSCANIGDMRRVYRSVLVMGGLHIGTPQGLNRARQYMDIVVTGQ